MQTLTRLLRPTLFVFVGASIHNSNCLGPARPKILHHFACLCARECLLTWLPLNVVFLESCINSYGLEGEVRGIWHEGSLPHQHGHVRSLLILQLPLVLDSVGHGYDP